MQEHIPPPPPPAQIVVILSTVLKCMPNVKITPTVLMSKRRTLYETLTVPHDTTDKSTFVLYVGKLG